jgi:hypothetical protein
MLSESFLFSGGLQEVEDSPFFFNWSSATRKIVTAFSEMRLCSGQGQRLLQTLHHFVLRTDHVLAR